MKLTTVIPVLKAVFYVCHPVCLLRLGDGAGAHGLTGAVIVGVIGGGSGGGLLPLGLGGLLIQLLLGILELFLQTFNGLA